MARSTRVAPAAVDEALAAVARRTAALATGQLSKHRRVELVALRRALDALSRAAERVGPPPAEAHALGFVVDAPDAVDCDDCGADSPEAKRRR